MLEIKCYEHQHHHRNVTEIPEITALECDRSAT